jgi:hypothetical protein
MTKSATSLEAGSWVTDKLGIRLTTTPAVPGAAAWPEPAELGLRINPQRAQLIISRLLGKHIPVPVADVLNAGHCLGDAVREACAGQTPVIVGFAETATGLGHAVASVAAADGGAAPYIHTTRRPAATGPSSVTFFEEHSHATGHTLAVLDEQPFRAGTPLVLVDDELSTGKTVVNAIRALHERWPRRHYVVASLIDSRTPAQCAAVEADIRQLGASFTSVMLFTGDIDLPADVLEKAAVVRAGLPPDLNSPVNAPAEVHTYDVALDIATTAAHGWDRDDETRLRAHAARLAERLPVARDGRTLVLGDEEFMYFPQLVAAALGDEVRTSTTTRSPAVTVDRAGYPLRTGLTFPATEDAGRVAYAYNVAHSQENEPGNAPGFDDIVFVTDAALADHVLAHTVPQLAVAARATLHVVAVTGRPATSLR